MNIRHDPIKPPKFHFKKNVNDDYRVCLKADGGESIGTIHKNSKGSWGMAYAGSDYERPGLYREFGHLVFDSREEAAAFLWLSKVEIDRVANEKPLTEDLSRYLLARARSVQDRIKSLVNELRDLRFEQHDLFRFAEKYNVERLTWRTEDGDPQRACKALLEFTRQGDKVPFFTEATLYELLGKDDARTVLALTQNVIRHASPQHEIEI